MEKAMYPSPYIRITQKHGIGSHVDSFAIDEAGSDGGIDFINAPFTGIVKRIYTKDANEVWLESVEPVLFADGTQDYMTIMVAHDNNVSNLKEGQIIKQGQRFYEEGTKGKASGNHVHLEVAKGKFSGTGWHKNNAGYWSINNGKKVDECLFIDDSYKILDTAGYNFKNVKEVEDKINIAEELQKELAEKEEIINNLSAGVTELTNTIIDKDKELSALKEQLANQPTLIFTTPKTDYYAIRLEEGQKLYLN